MERVKKYVGFLLILIVALFFSQPVFAEENTAATIGIRVETMDSTIIPLTDVTMPTTHKTFENYGLTGQTDPGFDTPVHVLAQYLMDNELASTETMSSMLGIEYNNLAQIMTMYANGSDTKDASHFWMYMVNDDYPALNGTGYNMNDCPLKNGDVITIYAMSYPGTEYYAFFNKQKIEVAQGEAAKLTLLGRSTMGGNSSPVSGAELIASTAGTSATIETDILTDANGQASISFNETGVYTISCKKDNITRAWAQITVVPSDDAADKTLVASDKAALTIPAETTANLSLADAGASAKTAITWTSSDPSVIQNDGKIIRGKADKTATLTATIKKGTQTETKAFPVTVKAFSDTEIKQMLADIKTALTAKTIRAVEGTDTNLIVKMQAQADLVTLGSTITLTDVKNQPQLTSDGTINYGSDAAMGKEVTFKISLLDNEETGVVKVSVPAHALTAQETVDDDVAQLTWDSIKKSNDAQDNVKTSLSLPTTGNSYATDISWEISNADVISKYGSVTRAAYGQPDAKVTLTATVAPGAYMEMYGHPGTAESKKVSFEVTVKAYTQEEYDAAKADVAKVKAYLQDTGKFKEMNTGAIADLANIDYDLQLTSNDAKTTGVSDVDVAWSSTNPGITVNTYRGKVTRPAINKEKTSGKLIATISKSGYSETLEFDTTVLALTQKEIDAENETIQKIAKDLTFDKIKKENSRAAYVTSGLQMVYRGYCDSKGTVTYSTKNSGEDGAAITWETSNADVIKTYGSVTRPKAADANVTMTATVSSIALKDVEGVVSKKVEIPVTVIKPTPKLGNVTLSSGALTFSPDTFEYTVEIPEDTTEITLGLTKLDADAVVEVEGAEIDANGSYLSKLEKPVTIKSTLGEDTVSYKINFITKNQNAATVVMTQISALPAADKLALTDKTAVTKARSAYDKLTTTQKAFVTNSNVLIVAEAKIAELEAADSDNKNKAAAKSVIDQIAALPAANKLVLTDKAAVKSARSAYDKLTTVQKILVSNLSTLIVAEVKIAELEVVTPGSATDKTTGIEVVGLPTGTGIKVVGESDDTKKTEEAQKAAEAAGITNSKIISLYDIKPDMSADELAKFNADPTTYVTINLPLSSDQQGYDSYKIYHKTEAGKVEWITPTLSADGKTLIFKVNAFSEFGIVGEKAATKTVNCSYQTQVENIGWQAAKTNGETSGTFGQSLRLEGIKINLDQQGYDLGVSYQTHVQDLGWQGFKKDGTLSGTENQAKRLEAIQIKLTGADADKFDIYYRVYAQNYGWMGWTKNGASAGTEGLSLRLEAIEIKVVAKDAAAPGSTEQSFVTGNIKCSYQTQIENIGWQDVKGNGDISGTSGQSLRLEGIKINLDNAGYDMGLSYQTHVQDIGWQELKTTGAMSGTEKQSKRLEAIRISLTGADANLCDIYYQVHAENIGWMGWAKNGESAGTEGFAYRLEAIRIMVVPKGAAAPSNETGNTEQAFVKSN